MSVNMYPVHLRMKIIDRGHAGVCPNTFRELRRYAIQDEDGVLREEITVTCTRKELDQKIAQIRISYRDNKPINITGTPLYTAGSPYRSYVKYRGAEPIGQAWSCNQATQRVLQGAGVPGSIAKIAGIAVDMGLTKKMHQDFPTNAVDMKEAFLRAFKW